MNASITDPVEAAIVFAQTVPDDLNKFCRSLDRLAAELTDEDKERGNPTLAAAARILADEVVRLRAEQQSQSIAFSDCCEARAVIAGNPGSTQWYACPECYDPCDVFIRTITTQPQ